MDTHAQLEIAPDAEHRQPIYQAPLRTWAGHGSGAICNECGSSIEEHEVEYEIELPSDGSDAQSLHFHFACYRKWAKRAPR